MKKLVMRFEEESGKSFKLELPDAKDGLTATEVNVFTQDILQKEILDRKVQGLAEAYLMKIEREELK